MRAVNVGDYVKIRVRGLADASIEKVVRLTKTQVVTFAPSWGAEGPTSEDRYQLSSGNRIGSYYSWYNKPFICDELPTDAEVSTFEEMIRAAQVSWETRMRAEGLLKLASPAILSLLEIPTEKLKLDWSFDKESGTSWTLKVEKLTESEIARICKI